MIRRLQGPQWSFVRVNFLFHFVPGCWRQLTLTRQATRRFTGHLTWPLYNKEISGLPNAVPGNAAACGAVLANTSTKMVLVHMVRLNDMVMQIKAWGGMANGVKAKAENGMANADQVRCNRSAHEAGRPRRGLVRLWRECGGVGRSEDRLGPTLQSPPNLFPMPVLVHTHPH